MLTALADTHAAIWYLFRDPRLSQTARNHMLGVAAAGHEVGISAITFTEVVYLQEKGRLGPDTLTALLAALRLPDPLLVEVPVTHEIAEAMSLIDRTSVPDLPDRIIAATALHLGVPLLSRDRKIRLSSVATIW
ncbi:MAG: type II toxin-antitoxin system VapC family toxin [Chloroflexota bacterium]